VEIQLRRLRRNLAERKIAMEVSDRAKALIAEKGYDPSYGARPLKRTIQRLIQDPLAVHILEGKFKNGDQVEIDVNDQDETLEFRHAAAARMSETSIAA
jgi:ATP-dependent Clp protease ATP-binding subunit ClpB